MRPRPRMFEEPNADFPSDEQIKRGAPASMSAAEAWLAEREAARGDAFEDWFEQWKNEPADEWFEQWKNEPADDVLFERYTAVTPAAEERPQRLRYRGGQAHVPAEYVGKLCVVIGAARRATSVRVRFEDGLTTTVKQKLLEEIAAG